MEAIIESLSKNKLDFFQVGFGVFFITWIGNIIRTWIYSIYTTIKSRFYYSARLAYPDSSFLSFLEWLSTQNMIFGTREVSVMTRYENMEVVSDSDLNIKLFPTGTQWFKFKGYYVSMTRVMNDKKTQDGVKEDHLDLSVYFGDRTIIADILATANEYSKTINRNKTKIFSLEPHSLYWECISVQNKRELQSVFLEKNTRAMVINDLNSFVTGKEWYSQTGVPYRRGYLLYGPPGTGKTSFILSIAGHFGKSISIMNMSKGVNDSNITSIIQKCQKDTILVFEDVDAAFVQRKSLTASILTFSGLLNAIDGLTNSNGRILVMTTNHIERLSTALIRPGRIDLKVKFDYATQYQIKKMFKRFFNDVKYTQTLTKVVDALKDVNVSTAQLQGWFIMHREEPELLVDSVNDFILKIKGDASEDTLKDDNRDKPKAFSMDSSVELGTAEIPKEGLEEEEEDIKSTNILRNFRRRNKIREPVF